MVISLLIVILIAIAALGYYLDLRIRDYQKQFKKLVEDNIIVTPRPLPSEHHCFHCNELLPVSSKQSHDGRWACEVCKITVLHQMFQ